MRIIQTLSKMIAEEIEDAKHYAECAIKVKDDYPKVADLFDELSNEEIKHAEKLHDAVAALIAEYKKTNGDPPAPMQAVYNYLHEEQIKKMAEAKALQEMYEA